MPRESHAGGRTCNVRVGRVPLRHSERRGGAATARRRNAYGDETAGTRLTQVNFRIVAEEDSQLIANMRARAEQCRRLAQALTDRRAAEVLVKMAEEVEADIAKLEEATGNVPNPMPPAPGA